MAKENLKEEFVRQLLAAQSSIYAYIVSLVPKRNDADDVLQQTNTVLLRKAAEYPEIKNFAAWACRVAYFEVLAYRTRQGRERVLFDDRLIELLADEATRLATGIERHRDALRKCLAALPGARRELVMKRYGSARSVKEIAEESGRPAGSLYQTLYRIRTSLLECIQRRLAVET